MSGGWITQADRSRVAAAGRCRAGRDPGRAPRLPVHLVDRRPGRVGAGRPSAALRRRRRSGRCSGLAAALALGGEREDQMSGGTAWLHARGRRDGVTVRLTATVFDDEEGDL